jgi:hypothetical protein
VSKVTGSGGGCVASIKTACNAEADCKAIQACGIACAPCAGGTPEITEAVNTTATDGGSPSLTASAPLEVYQAQDTAWEWAAVTQDTTAFGFPCQDPREGCWRREA